MTTPILQAQQVAKTFPNGNGTIGVLDSIDLSVAPGQTLSICGESGSGKSTLLHILAGLESLDSGEILWQGSPISQKSKSALATDRAHFIGMIFQSYHLIAELNLLENVLFAHRIMGTVGSYQRRRASDLLAQVGLGGRLTSSPWQLSGGERQRVAVARALMNKPPILLADEPTGNLDPETGQGVMDLLLSVCHEEQASLILVTHNADFASYTQEQYTLSAGKLLKID